MTKSEYFISLVLFYLTVGILQRTLCGLWSLWYPDSDAYSSTLLLPHRWGKLNMKQFATIPCHLA